MILWLGYNSPVDGAYKKVVNTSPNWFSREKRIIGMQMLTSLEL